jgi:hypothetical protein
MPADPLPSLRLVHEALIAARGGAVATGPDGLIDALRTLRELREELATWEPELITAARTAGASWITLAPALGVASRQAAERRYLRLQPSPTAERTGEARVAAERDKRAGDRAVSAWARDNSSALRQLAGQIGALDHLDTAGQAHAAQVQDALGDDDAASLLSPLAATQPHLVAEHSTLADRLTAVSDHTDKVRRDAITTRRGAPGTAPNATPHRADG